MDGESTILEAPHANFEKLSQSEVFNEAGGPDSARKEYTEVESIILEVPTLRKFRNLRSLVKPEGPNQPERSIRNSKVLFRRRRTPWIGHAEKI